jgi:hypothetical protein
VGGLVGLATLAAQALQYDLRPPVLLESTPKPASAVMTPQWEQALGQLGTGQGRKRGEIFSDCESHGLEHSRSTPHPLSSPFLEPTAALLQSCLYP